jgi:hypothetical protein
MEIAVSRTFSFRRVKHASPVKLKVLAEDLPHGPWLERLSAFQFGAVLTLGSILMASAVFVAASPQTTRYIDAALQTATKFTSKQVGEYQKPVAQVIRSNPTKQKIKKALPRSTGCDANYSGCVPIASDVDCRDGQGNGPAYSGRVEVVGYDVYGLDADGDGIGCE